VVKEQQHAFFHCYCSFAKFSSKEEDRVITHSSSNPTNYLERRKIDFLKNGFFSSSRRLTNAERGYFVSGSCCELFLQKTCTFQNPLRKPYFAINRLKQLDLAPCHL
jgi:hypothetical protein